MKNYRYGRFRFLDYCVSWFAITLLLLFSIVSIVLDLSAMFIIFPMAYSVAWLWVLLSPHCEKFILYNDSIIVFKGKKTNTISLPSALTLVVSYVDICPPLTIRTAFGNQTHILKDKYAISVLQKTSLDVALEALHRNYIVKYTTSRIQTVFDDYRYLYSFVCNQSLLEQLTSNRECLLIIPESLLDVISYDSRFVNAYVDRGH